MQTVDLKILDDRLRENLPAYATPGSAGLDLRACIDAPLTIAPGSTHLIPTGMAIHLANPHFAAMILPRSRRIARLQNSVTQFMSWVTRTIALAPDISRTIRW